MKICENCGAESPDDADTCLICGHKLPDSSSQDFIPNNNNLDFNNMNNPSPNQNTQEVHNICSRCGKENSTGAKFCSNCGAPLEGNTTFNQGQDFNNQQYQNQQYPNNQYNNQQYQNQQYQNNQQNQYNNQQFQNQYGNQQYQQNPMYQPNHSFYNPNKSVGLATVLSFIITALGQAYLGLYKRFAFEFLSLCLYGLIYVEIVDYIVPDVNVISNTQMLIVGVLFIIYVVYYIYTIYDTYKCARAVRFDTDLPLFLGRWDIE